MVTDVRYEAIASLMQQPLDRLLARNLQGYLPRRKYMPRIIVLG